MQIIILSARTGWHTDELSRALAERGHAGRVLPYESLQAHIGRRTIGSPRPAEADLSASATAVAPQRRSAGGQVRLDVHPSAPVTTTAQPRRSTKHAGRQVTLNEIASIFDTDAVLARIIPEGSLEQIIYRVDALHWIEERGIPVMNSARAIERSVDKFYTTALLHDAGLPVPETVVCERVEEAMVAVRRMLADGSVIIKPLFGSMGHGMVRVSDPDVAWRVVRTLAQIRSVFYVQRAIDHDGRDVRVFVIGGRVVGAIERRAAAGEWRTNVTRGGSAAAIDLPPVWQELALRAAAAVGADYAGVDLLPSRDRNPFVLEVNGIPGWEGLQKATGIDVAGAIVEHLATRVALHRGSAAGVVAGASA
jgi:RimK family alpha-L-glutamate ligase